MENNQKTDYIIFYKFSKQLTSKLFNVKITLILTRNKQTIY